MRRLSLRTLVSSGGLSGKFGGISIIPSSNGQALDSLHVAFDEQVGFSAALKMFDYDPAATIQDRDHNRSGIWTMRAPMLALANPDPELAFPPSTLLHPMLFVRNVTPQAQTVDLDFAWRADEAAKGYVRGPRFELGPLETRLVQIEDLNGDQAPPSSAHWSSVYLRTSAKPDEIVAVAASYDDTLRYGAQTPFIDQLSFLWKGGQFEFDENHNSLITVGNDSPTNTKTLFTLFYDDAKAQQHSYQLEQEVGPHDQMWINVGQLVRNRVPDRNGTTLPGDLKLGSYEFRDETHPGNGRLFEGKVIYDTSYGHVSYGCAACCGTSQARVTYNPFGIGVGAQRADQVQITDFCNTPWTDDSGDFYNWSVVNTAMAQTTIQGMHTGMGAGTTTSSTHGQLQGRPNRYTCPVQTFAPSGPTKVTAQVCPTSLSVSTPHEEALSEIFPSYKTGLGAVYEMKTANPQSSDDTQLVETVTLTGNGCAAYFNAPPNCGASSSPFLVNEPTTEPDGTVLLNKSGVFYDHHESFYASSVLPPGASCLNTCRQTYACGGVDVSPAFKITYNYQAGTLQGQNVTNVIITKTVF